MDVQLKNRLVGAAVLFSFGIVFIPMILDGRPGKVAASLVMPAEPGPLVQTMVMPKTVDLSLLKAQSAKPILQTEIEQEEANPHYQEDVLFNAEVKPQAKPPNTKPAKETRVAGFNRKAWVIQVGSFANRKNAHGLTLKLQKLGYQAYEEQVATKKGPIVRVRVGPEANHARAKKIRTDIKRTMNLSGLVVSYP